MTEDEPSETEKEHGHPGRMSAQEITGEIERLAREGEGADKRWALRVLYGEAAPTRVTLPPPLTGPEIISRFERLMIPGYQEFVRIAYKNSYGKHRSADDPVAHVNTEQLPETVRQKALAIRSIHALHKAFPELKTAGRKVGYPILAGPLVRQQWCQQQAMRAYADQMARDLSQPEPTDSEAPSSA